MAAGAKLWSVTVLAEAVPWVTASLSAPKYTVCEVASRPGRQFNVASRLMSAAPSAGSGSRACDRDIEESDFAQTRSAARPPQLASIVSLTYWAMTPPKSTMVLAV